MKRQLMGLAPLSFFLTYLLIHYQQGRSGEALWLCHISNLMLAIGLLGRQVLLIRIAALWLVPGCLLWLIDMAATGDVSLISIASHAGGLLCALAAIKAIGMPADHWRQAFLWGLFIQIMSNLFTAPALNVNASHYVYHGWERVFGVYWHYLIFNSLTAAGYLWLTARVLNKCFPPPISAAQSSEAMAAINI